MGVYPLALSRLPFFKAKHSASLQFRPTQQASHIFRPTSPCITLFILLSIAKDLQICGFNIITDVIIRIYRKYST